jgi:hypothetical protein
MTRPHIPKRAMVIVAYPSDIKAHESQMGDWDPTESVKAWQPSAPKAWRSIAPRHRVSSLLKMSRQR